MDTELIISWIHQYNLMRTFPHIWRRKNNKEKKVRKWKEHNTMIWIWLWNLLYTLDIPVLLFVLLSRLPLWVSLGQKEGKSCWSPLFGYPIAIWSLSLSFIRGKCGNQFWELVKAFFTYLESYYKTRVGYVICLSDI